jgi:hypothetical protein
VISAETMAGSASSARARSKSGRAVPQARQPLRRGTVSRTVYRVCWLLAVPPRHVFMIT